MLFYTGTAGTTTTEKVRFTSAGKVDISANIATDYGLYVHNDGDNVNRYGMGIQCGHQSTGTNLMIDFFEADGGNHGSITQSGSTVSYGAFTAHHDVELPEADDENGYSYGTLVEHTEIFYTQKDGVDSERGIRYKIQKSSSSYSKSILGAYSAKYSHLEKVHQVGILGDGHILCNGEKAILK